MDNSRQKDQHSSKKYSRKADKVQKGFTAAYPTQSSIPFKYQPSRIPESEKKGFNSQAKRFYHIKTYEVKDKNPFLPPPPSLTQNMTGRTRLSSNNIKGKINGSNKPSFDNVLELFLHFPLPYPLPQISVSLFLFDLERSAWVLVGPHLTSVISPAESPGLMFSPLTSRGRKQLADARVFQHLHSFFRLTRTFRITFFWRSHHTLVYGVGAGRGEKAERRKGVLQAALLGVVDSLNQKGFSDTKIPGLSRGAPSVTASHAEARRWSGFTDEGAEAQGGDVPWGQTLALLSSGPCYHHFGHISLTKGWMDALS
eukprot:bmy_04563T0